MNEQKHIMTGAWALNALEAEEREQMRRYLAEDPEAAAEAAAFEETAAELAGSLPPLAPRPDLKAAVMARIATTRQLSPLPEEEPSQEIAQAAEHPDATSTGAPGSVTVDPSSAPPATAPAGPPADPTTDPTADDASAPPAPSAQVVSLDRYRASVRRSRWAAVAAALLLVTTIAGATLWSGERAAQQEARASLEAIASAQASAEEERAMLSTILASEDAAHLVFPAADGGSLQLMYSRDQQAMLLQGSDLPTLPEDETYQLWMIDGSDIVSAGLLEDSADAVIHEGTIPAGVAVGLTIEPEGGSDQPSMEPIASGVLT